MAKAGAHGLRPEPIKAGASAEAMTATGAPVHYFGDGRFLVDGAAIGLHAIAHAYEARRDPDVPVATNVTLNDTVPSRVDSSGRGYAVITLYQGDPPLTGVGSREPGVDRGTDFRDPVNLVKAAYTNYVSPVLTADPVPVRVASHPIGHFFVKVEVPGYPTLLTGMTTIARAGPPFGREKRPSGGRYCKRVHTTSSQFSRPVPHDTRFSERIPHVGAQPKTIRLTGTTSMINRTARRRLATVLLMCGVVLSAGHAMGATVEGTWIVKDDVALNIYECGGRFCARIAWIKDTARRPTQCGRTIAWGLQAKSVNQWDGGTIVDPDDENVYRLAAEFGPDGTLRAHIFKGISILGKTEVLKRIDVHSLSGLC